LNGAWVKLSSDDILPSLQSIASWETNQTVVFQSNGSRCIAYLLQPLLRYPTLSYMITATTPTPACCGKVLHAGSAEPILTWPFTSREVLCHGRCSARSRSRKTYYLGLFGVKLLWQLRIVSSCGSPLLSDFFLSIPS